MAKQPLLVQLVFHPGSAAALELARHIHRQLNDDPMVPGLRVPTIFCPASAGGLPPSEYRLNFAERNFIVLLADDRFSIADEWCRFAADLWEKCREPSARFVPMQLSTNAWPLDERLRGVSFAHADLQPEGQPRDAFVVRRIIVELCRYLSGMECAGENSIAPVRLFLSHTKVDLKAEPSVTLRFIDALRADQPIEAWVDSGDIPTGSKFRDAIQDGVQGTSLLAILTDNYATREWCREEVLLAKEHQRPVAVVDALNSYEVRSFPYLGKCTAGALGRRCAEGDRSAA